MPIRVYPVKSKSRKFYYMYWVHPHTGKRIYESTKCLRRRDAERIAKAREDELNAPIVACDGSTPWLEAVEQYSDEHMSGNATSTEERAIGILSSFRERMEIHVLSDATARSVSAYVGKLRNEGRLKADGTPTFKAMSEQTIGLHLRHLKAFLNWSVTQDLLPSCPKFPAIRRSSGSRVSHGRPLEDTEFFRLEEEARKVDEELAAFLRGIWLSGLRLAEARRATWTPSEFQVDLSGERPYYRIWSGAEKGRETRLLAITPDAAEFFQGRAARRAGDLVFDLGELHDSTISHRVSKLSKKAGVFVLDSRGRQRPAGCHDLRRSFGQRWAPRVPPLVLMELMRHADIKTTLAYYVTEDAKRTSDIVWKFGGKTGGTTGTPGDPPQQAL